MPEKYATPGGLAQDTTQTSDAVKIESPPSQGYQADFLPPSYPPLLPETMSDTSKEGILKHLGIQIRRLRKNARLSGEQLGALLGVRVQTIYKYENGAVKPSYIRLLQIATLFGISINFFFQKPVSPAEGQHHVLLADEMQHVKETLSCTEEEIKEHVGRRLESRLKMLQMTQMELGRLTDRTHQSISKMTSGEQFCPPEALFRVAEALGVPVSYFFEGTVRRDLKNVSPK